MRAIIPLIVLVLCLTGCGGALSLEQPELDPTAGKAAAWNPLAPSIEVRPLMEALATAPFVSSGGYRVSALGAANLPDAETLAALRLEAAGDTLAIYSDAALPSASLYVRFDPEREHVTSAEVKRGDGLGLAIVRRGLVAIAVTGTGGALLDPAEPLAVVSFTAGAEPVAKIPAEISQVPRSKVKDLQAIYDGESSATLSWFERHNGDYNLDGEVGVNDLTPLGLYFDQPAVEGEDDWALIEVVDGDEDGLITVADITPIGQSFLSFITGYNVYRTPLAEPEEEPDPADSGRWEKVLNNAEPTGPSAPRDYNGQKTRLQYTFLDTPEEPGSFGWYVVPVGKPGETPLEGPVSNVATTMVVPPGVALSFEIQAPKSELLNVGNEFYIGVRVANVEGLFSANVRFEYDSTLVEYVDSVAFYTDELSTEHPNLLEPPLFVGADVGDIADGYREVGFNATQRKDLDEPKDGEGFVGYVKFRCIDDGINEECFRFPQSSVYLYLWGATYGVPVGIPELGDPQIVNIAE